MQALLDSLIDWFALPRNGLSSVFLVAFVSATLLPMGSEPAVFGYVKHSAVARHRDTRSLDWLRRFGPKALLLSWLPVVGDPLCAVAGWLRLSFWPCVAWMAVGKLLRYITMTGALLWVPDDWWRRLLGWFAGG